MEGGVVGECGCIKNWNANVLVIQNVETHAKQSKKEQQGKQEDSDENSYSDTPPLIDVSDSDDSSD